MKNLQVMKNLSTVKEEQRTTDDRSYSDLFKNVNKKLIEHGFGENLDSLDDALIQNPHLYNACNKLYANLQRHRCVFLLSNSGDIMWKIHAYFPVLYAINNLGQSVHRTTVKNLIDSILSKDESSKKLEFKQSLTVFTGILYPDPRLNTMGPSIEYIFEDVICNSNPNKKIVFTAYNYFGNRTTAINDGSHRLQTYYSSKLEDIFKRNVDLLFINTPSEVRSSWLKEEDE